MQPRYLHHRDHAILRARERYGVQLSRWDYHQLCRQIRGRDPRRARLIVDQTPRVAIWLVLYATTWMVATYDKRWRIITTFLPLGVEFDDQGKQNWDEGAVYAPGYKQR